MSEAYKNATQQLEYAWNNFNFVTDKDLIDFCIYQINSYEILSDSVLRAEKEKRAARTAQISKKSFVDKLHFHFTRVRKKYQLSK